jgi:hypothetical protein
MSVEVVWPCGPRAPRKVWLGGPRRACYRPAAASAPPAPTAPRVCEFATMPGQLHGRALRQASLVWCIQDMNSGKKN